MSCKHGHDVAAVLSRAQLCVQHVDTDQLLSMTRGYLARHVGRGYIDQLLSKTRGYLARHVDIWQDIVDIWYDTW